MIRLPFPPSVNTIYRNVPGKGRVKTGKYKAWCEEAALRAGYVEPIHGFVKLDIILGKPDKRKRDLDNYLKATLDFLVDYQVIDDDSYVDDLRIRWGEVDGAHVSVELVPCWRASA